MAAARLLVRRIPAFSQDRCAVRCSTNKAGRVVN